MKLLEQWITDLVDPYYLRIIILLGINIIMALGLNITTGVTGQLSMGHAGFMSLGAYTSAILSIKLGAPFWLALLAGAVVAALFGFIIGLPALRLEGDYLAIVTIGFAEIVRVFFLNFEPGGKAVGLSGIPQETSFTLVLVSTIVVIFFTNRLLASRIGKAMYAIRENEIAAEACGINTTHLKVLSFVLGAFLGGLGGALYAHYMYYISPQDFDFMRSIEILNMVVLGGLGSIPGAILGAAILTVLPEVLRVVAEYRMLFYGALLVLLMIFRPNGLFGDIRLYDLLKSKRGKEVKSCQS